MAKQLTAMFNKYRTANQIVDDLKSELGLKFVELFIERGKPRIQFCYEDADGYMWQRTRSLLDLDTIVREFTDKSFNEIFDYVYSVWGKDSEGNWYLGYER